MPTPRPSPPNPRGPVPSHFFRQAGVLAVRSGPDGREVLLVSSRGGKRWVIPKGVVDPGEAPRDAAAREAWEEAGLTGPIAPEAAGLYRYHKWAGTCIVEVFTMEVTGVADDFPERGERKRRWASTDEAAALVREEGLKKLIKRVPEGRS